jgi:hypothetical protein
VALKQEFWTPSPNSWDSTCQVHPFDHIYPIKRHDKGQRKEIYYKDGQMLWKEVE